MEMHNGIDSETFPPPLSAMKEELYETQNYHHTHLDQQYAQEFMYPGMLLVSTLGLIDLLRLLIAAVG